MKKYPLPLSRVAGGPPCFPGQRIQFRSLSGKWDKKTVVVKRVWLYDDWGYLGYGGGPCHWRIEFYDERSRSTGITGIGAPDICGKIARALPPLITVPLPRIGPNGGWGRRAE